MTVIKNVGYRTVGIVAITIICDSFVLVKNYHESFIKVAGISLSLVLLIISAFIQMRSSAKNKFE